MYLSPGLRLAFMSVMQLTLAPWARVSLHPMLMKGPSATGSDGGRSPGPPTWPAQYRRRSLRYPRAGTSRYLTVPYGTSVIPVSGVQYLTVPYIYNRSQAYSTLRYLIYNIPSPRPLGRGRGLLYTVRTPSVHPPYTVCTPSIRTPSVHPWYTVNPCIPPYKPVVHRRPYTCRTLFGPPTAVLNPYSLD